MLPSSIFQLFLLGIYVKMILISGWNRLWPKKIRPVPEWSYLFYNCDFVPDAMKHSKLKAVTDFALQNFDFQVLDLENKVFRTCGFDVCVKSWVPPEPLMKGQVNFFHPGPALDCNS